MLTQALVKQKALLKISQDASKPVKKALKVEEFLPLDDILETSSKWKAWRRKIEIQMDYFDITDPNITLVIDLIKQEKKRVRQ